MWNERPFENVGIAFQRHFRAVVFSTNSNTQIAKKFSFLLRPNSAPLVMKWNSKTSARIFHFIVPQTRKENIKIHGNILTSQAFHFVYAQSWGFAFKCLYRELNSLLKLRSQSSTSSGSSQPYALMWLLSPEVPSKFLVDCNLI